MQEKIDKQIDAALRLIEQGNRNHDEVKSLLKRLVWIGAIIYKKEERKERGARFREKHQDSIKAYQENYRKSKKKTLEG